MTINDSFTSVSVNNKAWYRTYNLNAVFDNWGGHLEMGLVRNDDATNVLFGPAYKYPATWVYIPIINIGNTHRQLIIEVEHNRCDTLEAYLIYANARNVFLGRLYRSLPLLNRPVPSRYFALPFEVKKKDSVVLALLSKRVTGIHELQMAIAEQSVFTIINSKEEIIRIIALASAWFFVFAVFATGLIFKHRLLVRFGLYILGIGLGLINFNYFFDHVAFPSFLQLNPNNVGIFIIFLCNSLTHVFSYGYIVKRGMHRFWHTWATWSIVGCNCIPMVMLLFLPLGYFNNLVVTNASLFLTTINIIWMIYVALLGYLSKRDTYLLVAVVFILLPVLYKTFIVKEPALNFTYLQPVYFLLLFGYLIISLFKQELTSREIAKNNLTQVHNKLDQLRKTEVQHIGRNLHDQLGNTLASALGYLNTRQPNTEVSRALILEAISEIRLISHNLVKNDDRPLSEKLEDITERFNDFSDIIFEFKDYSGGGIDRLSMLQQQNIYMIAQEVLNNIVKHSYAREANIQVFEADDQMVRISIEDDGVGFSKAAKKTGIGIPNMHKRAALANLQLTLDSSPGGTHVIIETLPE